MSQVITIPKDPTNETSSIDISLNNELAPSELEKKFKNMGFSFSGIRIYRPAPGNQIESFSKTPNGHSYYSFYKQGYGGHVIYNNENIKPELHFLVDPPRAQDRLKTINTLLQELNTNLEVRYAP